MSKQWLLDGAKKDGQSIGADWRPTRLELIDGVQLKEIKNVPKEAGMLTEIYRADWELDGKAVDQIFQVALLPGAVTGWHAHEFTQDRLFVNDGLLKVVLYDSRPDSPTLGVINEFKLGTARPGIVVVPPKVWHAVANISSERALLLNIVDRAYCYEDPDHWRLPADTRQIPYSLAGHLPARDALESVRSPLRPHVRV